MAATHSNCCSHRLARRVAQPASQLVSHSVSQPVSQPASAMANFGGSSAKLTSSMCSRFAPTRRARQLRAAAAAASHPFIHPSRRPQEPSAIHCNSEPPRERAASEICSFSLRARVANASRRRSIVVESTDQPTNRPTGSKRLCATRLALQPT